jgi:Leucine-rich repeat (LRR) protein
MLIVNSQKVKEEGEVYLVGQGISSCLAKSSIIRALYLSGNQLSSFDTERLPSLKKLELSYNRFLTFEINYLPNLRTLNLSSNRLMTFNVGYLPNLRELHISYNQLSTFEIGENLPNIQEVYLCSNRISTFKIKGPLPRLMVIDLSCNQLEAFEVEQSLNLHDLFLYKNPNLTVLNVNSLDLGFIIHAWDTNVRFVDASIISRVKGLKVQVREHTCGISEIARSAFHSGNPIAEEIIGEIQI